MTHSETYFLFHFRCQNMYQRYVELYKVVHYYTLLSLINAFSYRKEIKHSINYKLD